MVNTHLPTTSLQNCKETRNSQVASAATSAAATQSTQAEAVKAVKVNLPNSLTNALVRPLTNPAQELLFLCIKQKQASGELCSSDFSDHSHRHCYIAQLQQARIRVDGSSAHAPIYEKLEAEGKRIVWTFSSELLQLLSGRGYTRIDLGEFKQKPMRGNYASALFLLLHQFRKTGLVKMKESTLRRLLGIPEGSYPKPSHLKNLLRRALSKVQQATSVQLNSITLKSGMVELQFAFVQPPVALQAPVAIEPKSWEQELTPEMLQALMPMQVRQYSNLRRAGVDQWVAQGMMHLPIKKLTALIFQYYSRKNAGRWKGEILNLPAYCLVVLRNHETGGFTLANGKKATSNPHKPNTYENTQTHKAAGTPVDLRLHVTNQAAGNKLSTEETEYHRPLQPKGAQERVSARPSNLPVLGSQTRHTDQHYDLRLGDPTSLGKFLTNTTKNQYELPN